MLRSSEDSETGNGPCKPGSEEGFREEWTLELQRTSRNRTGAEWEEHISGSEKSIKEDSNT